MKVLLLCSFVVCLLLSTSHAITVGSPIKAIYVDWHLNWNAPQQSILDAVNAGFNVVIISFYLSSGSAADMAQAWAALSDSVKQSTINSAHVAGAVVTVSLGGSTDSPYDKNAYNLGVAAGKWAQAQYLDGVDFDLENLAQGFKAGSFSDAQTVQWIADLTTGCHDTLGNGGVISHAPQSPYFGPVGATNTWTGATGGYTSVYKKVADYITFFNVQFYNQGASCYADFDGLFTSSSNCPNFPSTAVMEIANAGVPLSKIVVGKPVTSADAGSGYVDAGSLASFFQQAKSKYGWNAGIMGWVWNDPATCKNWVKTIYGGGGSSGGVASSVSDSSSSSSGSGSGSSSSGSGSGSSASSSSSGSSGAGCTGRTTGMYCVDSTHFEWCPQGITQVCSPGTQCKQVGNSIECA